MGAPYQSQTVSGYNSSPPPDDGTTVPANKITWNSTIKQKLADPLNTFIAAINSQLNTWSDFSSVTTSTNLTTTTAHHMQTIEVTSGSPTISLGDAATMTKNYVVTVTNSGTGAPVVNLATAANTLDGTANGTFTFPTGTKTSFTFKVNNAASGYYTEVVGGKTILAQTSVVTPVIDSGSTGAVFIKNNNGTTVAQFNNGGSDGNNLLTLAGLNVTGAFQTDSSGNGHFIIGTVGGNDQSFKSSGGVQLQVLHTASATRNVTITGSNGGNPTIAVTGGNLAISNSVLIAGLALSVANTPALNGTINIPYNGSLQSRNSNNSGDINLLLTSTVNSALNVVTIASSGSGGVVIQGRSGSGAPTTSDLASGQWALWRDTSGATTKIYYNNAGSIQSVALA